MSGGKFVQRGDGYQLAAHPYAQRGRSGAKFTPLFCADALAPLGTV